MLVLPPRFNKNQASNDSLIVAATDILQKPDGKYFDFDDGDRCSACHIEAISKQKNSLEPQILITSDWCTLRDSAGSIVQLGNWVAVVNDLRRSAVLGRWISRLSAKHRRKYGLMLYRGVRIPDLASRCL